MTVKCCGTCSHVTDIYVVDKCWCLLSDEPVGFDEKCDSWSKE